MEDEIVRQKEIDLIVSFFMLLGNNGLEVLDLGDAEMATRWSALTRHIRRMRIRAWTSAKTCSQSPSNGVAGPVNGSMVTRVPCRSRVDFSTWCTPNGAW